MRLTHIDIKYPLAEQGLHWVWQCGEAWPPWFPAAWLAELDRICSVICWESAYPSVILSAFLDLNIIRCRRPRSARYQTKLLLCVRNHYLTSSWASGRLKPLFTAYSSPVGVGRLTPTSPFLSQCPQLGLRSFATSDSRTSVVTWLGCTFLILVQCSRQDVVC